MKFFVEIDDEREHARLMAIAKRRGTYSEDNDDWFEPSDITTIHDAESLPAAKRLAKRLLKFAIYGEARVYERVPDYTDDGEFCGYDSVEREVVK